MTPGPGDTRSNYRTWHKIIDELGGSSREYFAVRERGVRKGAGLWRGSSGVRAGVCVEKCWGSFRAVLRRAGTWPGGSRGGRRVAWSKSWSLAAPRSGRAVGGLGANVGREPGLGGAPGGGWGAGGGGRRGGGGGARRGNVYFSGGSTGTGLPSQCSKLRRFAAHWDSKGELAATLVRDAGHRAQSLVRDAGHRARYLVRDAGHRALL